MMNEASRRSADHLGGAAEGEAPDVGGDEVDPGVGHSDVPGVCVHQALVVDLQGPAHCQVRHKSLKVQMVHKL